MWLAGRLSGPPESASRRRVVRAAVACARLSLPFVREEDLLGVLLALHIADEYAAGREDTETACVAWAAAWAAGAARDAGDAWAARAVTLARCADEVRRIIPHRVIAQWAREEE